MDFDLAARQLSIERDMQVLDSLTKDMMVLYNCIKTDTFDDEIYRPILEDMLKTVDKVGEVIREKLALS